LCFVDGLLQDDRSFTGSERSVTGDNNDPNTPIVQLIDQDIGPLAAAKAEVDERNVWDLLGDQTLGRGGRGDGSSYVRPASLEQALHGNADVPAIFDHKDTHSVQIRGCGLQRAIGPG